MALFNYATKEITLKIVYYGPGLSGKTTNLQFLHSVLDPKRRGKLLSLSTEADRTLFFDFMPVELGKIKDFSFRFQLYTVPGQVRYNATRRLVLKGADAVVFVADSQKQMIHENIESLNNMRENLIANNLDPGEIPIVFQYNKRDLPGIMSLKEINKRLNIRGSPFFEAVAVEGKGVNETFENITRILLKDISAKHKIDLRLSGKGHTVDRAAVATAAPKPVETASRNVTGGKQPERDRNGLDDVLTEIVKQLSVIRSSVDHDKGLKETILHFEASVEKLSKNLTDSISKQDEIVYLLKEIREAISNAKTGKRWLFFR
ncbi:mutual gliding-motility protein MglA [bacterium BMS3Bbin06]|nr:mutual gliding-motility protein MglA [bacterium BMS3Abin08]GBE35758.1 mutual gliding-motility protein MglA [bacterium BMS3Bbin06]HDO35843.1 gliding-motility protein MglA [Nitrospirota bacterium]HDY71325.1 gliding-motility protein MglA [Nitrospirota bacterium]